MSTNLLAEIRAEIAKRETELTTLRDAVKLIESIGSGRSSVAVAVGRPKASVVDSPAVVVAAPAAKKAGRRGRPKGSKNKPGAKKTGPKKSRRRK